MAPQPLTPRERVKLALSRQEPDRVPVDFLATPEVWRKLVNYIQPDSSEVGESNYFDPAWEALLRRFEVDCRLLSYDQFCNPPASVLYPGAEVVWWDVLMRSTPNRMWRQRLPNGRLYDIWGRPIHIVEHAVGAYEEADGWALQAATSVAELKHHLWPEPDWWDFSPLPEVIARLDPQRQYHLRYRIGSVFESAWQLRGMQEFLMDLIANPAIPIYIMERLTEIHLENTRRVLELVGNRLDMVYFYDDVATQNSLMISPAMWREFVRPHHARLIELVKSYNLPVMYHCDGAIYPLIEELIELGVDLLNPVQPDAKQMEPARLKQEFGERLAFHGGVDIIRTLPQGKPADVAAEVKERVRVLGQNGGYIMASSHHIQPDTPIENVLAMYDVSLRYRT
jgi:uroporphyrinogen decarboxylase